MQSNDKKLNIPSSQQYQTIDGKIKVHKEIGSGLQSRVFLVSSLQNNDAEINQSQELSFSSEPITDQKFALKTFEKDEFKALGLREFQLLKNIESNPHILRVFDHQESAEIETKKCSNDLPNLSKSNSSESSNSSSSNQQGNALLLQKGFDYITMEYCSNGDLFDFVKKNGKLSEGLTKHLFHQLLDSLEFLHEKVGVAHLDLKLENVLVSDNYQLKLCDFGFYEELKSKVCKNRGTHGYRAPETYVQSNEGFEGDKADIFALGVILFIMIFGVPPFNQATKEDALYRLFYRGANSFKFFLRMHYATKPLYNQGSIDPNLVELLFALLDENPSNRPQSINEIRQFAYLQNNLISADIAQSEMSQLIQKHKITQSNEQVPASSSTLSNNSNESNNKNSKISINKSNDKYINNTNSNEVKN